MQTEVLIVGAGPSGLVLALWLTRLGVRVRIIDRAPQSGMASRAFALQARTLELYDQMGLAQDALARGAPVTSFGVHRRGKPPLRAPFGDFGRGLSPFPFVLILLQDDHEKLLIAHLAQTGVQVERGVELVDLEDLGDRVSGRLKGPGNADTTCEADFVCGCDGAASVVRELMHISFPGGASEEIFYVANIEATGALVDGGLHYLMAGDDVCSVFPLKGKGRVRLIGLVPKSVRSNQVQFDFDDVIAPFQRASDLEVTLVESFTSYRVHRRIADQWRKGRVFLLGDASHVHSPAGGQGLNAGIGDAVNLAWKLGAVLKGAASANLLDTYQDERIRAARQIAATTERGFVLQARRGRLMGWVRERLISLAPRLLSLRPFRRMAFRTIAQLAVHYRGAEACRGRAGAIAGGDRLPWAQIEGDASNHAALRDMAWQVQIFGEASAPLSAACARWNLPLRVFDWTAKARKAGFTRDAAYLVRPDGYVALASPAQNPAAIQALLDRYGILTPRPTPGEM
ncbi:MAG: FAD-dependent monooxygenase [Caulobacteraceae bacterium]|nr:FAD-dependent monooxygenase [Caulobacteraceae bacterium]